MARKLVGLLLVGCAWLMLSADAVASRTLKGYKLAGSKYVLVRDMASFYQLGTDRDSSSNRATYRSVTGELSLELHQREIQLNGVKHWLSAPIIEYRGRLFISSTDLLKTIDPVLRRGREATPRKIKQIVLDPGHGGRDTGTRGRKGIEKTLVLEIAQQVKELLEERGLTVMLTRSKDTALSLEDRPAYADKRDADLFVSIHLNAGGNATGIETYCLPPAGAVSTATSFSSWQSASKYSAAPNNQQDAQNIWLAHCLQKSLVNLTGAADRGVRRSRFLVIREATCPAVLVEAGFLSNPVEEKKLLTAQYQAQLAKAITQGILDYRTGVERK